MKVIDPGHKYEMDMLDGMGPHLITYVKREGDGYPGNVGHYKGTNLQEVLRTQINRVIYLDNQDPCPENVEIIGSLRHVLMLLELRAARKHGSGILKIRLCEEFIETLPTCEVCGHVVCNHPKTEHNG